MERITLEISDDVLPRAREAANQSHRPVEEILNKWLERGAISEPLNDLIQGIEYPIYTPFDSYEAARIMEAMLKEAGKKSSSGDL